MFAHVFSVQEIFVLDSCEIALRKPVINSRNRSKPVELITLDDTLPDTSLSGVENPKSSKRPKRIYPVSQND